MENHQKTSAESLDTLYDGRLSVLQPKTGYRLSIDSLLLTYFLFNGKRAKRCTDLGTGCGVIGLGLLLSGHVDSVAGVELQPGLARLARRNAELNHLERRFTIVEGDVRECAEALGEGSFDLVVSNPPFWPEDAGRPPTDRERRVACHEIHGDIRQWCESAARLLNQKRGRFGVVYPARRLNDLFAALHAAHLYASRLQAVHPQSDRSAELVMVESRWGTRGQLLMDPSLVLKARDGTDTAISKTITSGRFSDALRAQKDMRSRR